MPSKIRGMRSLHSFSNPVRRLGLEARRTFESLGWQGLLNRASGESEVLGVVKDYIARLSLEELVQLPNYLMPPRLVDADDVSSYAFLLARQQQLGETSEVLDKLAGFVTNAAQRLSRLLFRSRRSRSGDMKAA